MKSLFQSKQKEFFYNPWHGCKRISQGCKNCFVYAIDSIYGKDTRFLHKTKNYDLIIQKGKDKSYKIPDHALIYTCLSSDFFIEEADLWRSELWKMIKIRKECDFMIFTKRIDRFMQCVPDDWGRGYENVHIACSVENQARANERLSLFVNLPIKHRHIAAAPLLEALNLKEFLHKDIISSVSVGGESGLNARLCDYEWVLDIRRQCEEARVNFSFHQTGARFKKEGKIYKIAKNLQRSQAKKADIDLKFE